MFALILVIPIDVPIVLASATDAGKAVAAIFRCPDNYYGKVIAFAGDKKTVKQMAAILTKHLSSKVFRPSQVGSTNGSAYTLKMLKYPICHNSTVFIYKLITAHLLLRVNCDKIMHARWDFDASSAQTWRFSQAGDTRIPLPRKSLWTPQKLSTAKLDFVQVCGLSLNFYNNTLCKFYKFSDSRKTWTSPTLQSADWPISRQYHRPQVLKRVSYPEVYKYIQNPWLSALDKHQNKRKCIILSHFLSIK